MENHVNIWKYKIFTLASDVTSGFVIQPIIIFMIGLGFSKPLPPIEIGTCTKSGTKNIPNPIDRNWQHTAKNWENCTINSYPKIMMEM